MEGFLILCRCAWLTLGDSQRTGALQSSFGWCSSPVHHVAYKVEMKWQAVLSPPPPASPLTLNNMARAALQVAVLANQEFRNYSIMLIDEQIGPSPSFCVFGLLPNMNHKGNVSSTHTGFVCLVAEDSAPVRPGNFEDCVAVWGDAEKIDHSGFPIYKSKWVLL